MAHQGQEITNPRTGQWMKFLSIEPSSLVIESVSPSGSEAESEPLHVHPKQESGCEVRSGALVFEVNGDRREVAAGESITIPAGTPHRFWNDSGEDARSVQHFAPALRIAEFFEAFFALADLGQLTENGMPKLLPLAVMVGEFGDEIRPVFPPWPLVWAMSGALGPIARARGKGQGWLSALA